MASQSWAQAMRNCAPIALFAYNRPDHLAKTLNALRANPEAQATDLFVFSDGPRDETAAPMVADVRKLLGNVPGFRSVTIINRERNYGLGKSIIDGVSTVCAKFGRVIVLEDDLVTSPFFLQYMNDGLDFYNDDIRVASVLGYALPLPVKAPETYFIRGADCLGWATWQRAWSLFEPDGQILLYELELTRQSVALDLNGALAFTQMLRDQIAGRNSSWAVRWHVSMFLRDMLTLTPHRSLVLHIGNDGSGTNFGNETLLDTVLSSERVMVRDIPVEEHIGMRQATERYYFAYKSMSARLFRRIHRTLHFFANRHKFYFLTLL
jgi:hypothetical protein